MALPALAQPFGTGHQDGHFSRPETGPTATPKEKIVGHCMVVAGGGTLMAQPCGNLLLTLTPTDGGGILYSRTSNAGRFEFDVPSDKKFKIGVNSRFFQVVSPTTELERGQDISLQLSQVTPK